MNDSRASAEGRWSTGQDAGSFATIPDLSIQDFASMDAMNRTRWFARVVLPASSSPTLDEPLCAEIEDRLGGRMPSVGFERDGSLHVVFNVETGNDESRERVRTFAEALASVCKSRVRDINAHFSIGYMPDPLGLMPVDYDAIKRD